MHSWQSMGSTLFLKGNDGLEVVFNGRSVNRCWLGESKTQPAHTIREHCRGTLLTVNFVWVPVWVAHLRMLNEAHGKCKESLWIAWWSLGIFIRLEVIFLLLKGSGVNWIALFCSAEQEEDLLRRKTCLLSKSPFKRISCFLKDMNKAIGSYFEKKWVLGQKIHLGDMGENNTSTKFARFILTASCVCSSAHRKRSR